MTEKSRYRAAYRILLFWTVFIGIGAVGGAACMLADPTGRLLRMDAMLPYFQVLPFADTLFRDFTFSGIALLIVNGISNLTAAVLLLMHKKAGDSLGGIFGVTLMLWICIQFYMFPPNVMSTAYFIFGLCQAATGWAAVVFARQEAFRVEPADYPQIGTDALCEEAGLCGGEPHRRCGLRSPFDGANRRDARLLVVRSVRYASLGHADRADRR